MKTLALMNKRIQRIAAVLGALALLFALTVSVPAAQAAVVNLAPNPGFETVCGSAPCNWNGDPSFITLASSTTAHSDSSSLQVTTTSDGYGAVSDCIAVAGGTQYDLSAWYAAQDANLSGIALSVSFYTDANCTAYDSGSGPVGGATPNTDGGWYPLSGSTTTPADANSAVFALVPDCGANCPTTVLFDDVSFAQAVPPTISASATVTFNGQTYYTYFAGEWIHETVTVHFTCSAGGAATITSCPADQIYSSEGTFTASGTATQDDGLSAQTSFGPIKIDLTPPTISGSGTNASGRTVFSREWVSTASVTVHFTCSDALSGIQSCSADRVVSSEGQTFVSGSARDRAGNSRFTNFSVWIDKTPPTITATATNADNTPYTSGTWTNQNVTVHFTCSDSGGSGLRTSCPADVIVSDEGVTPVTGNISDNAGNSATANVSVQIDTTPPQLTGCDAPDSNWHNADVTLKCHYTDGVSGPATQDVSLSTNVAANSETNNASASANGAQACDAGGNCAATPADIAGNQIDEKAPGISITSPTASSYLLGQVVATNYTCSDGGSGVASCAGSVANGANINTASVGAKTFTVNGADNAGNMSSQSVNYSVIYNFSGFFSPVLNAPALNQVSAGNSVALKFSLAANQGLNIFPANFPASRAINCSTLAPLGSYQATGPSGKSGLQYDATTNQYTYSWKTDKAWARTCRQFDLKLNDGTEHLANFKFK
jgi:hypothetical protein